MFALSASILAACALFAAPPTPAPTLAVPVAVSTPAPTLPSATHSAPIVYRNRLVGGGVNTGLSWYTSCNGSEPLTRATAAIDACFHDRTYFVGHNVGVFTPIMSWHVGSTVVWWDDASRPRLLRVIGVRTMSAAQTPPPLMAGADVQLQTCVNADGSVDRVLDLA